MGIKMSSKKSSNFLLQGSILAAASIIVRIIGLLYRAPLTQIIGNEGNGYFSAAYTIYAMVLLISSYSIPLAVSKIISAKLALGEYRNAHRIFVGSMGYAIVVGGIASIFTYVCAPYLVSGNMAGAYLALRVLAPTIFFSAILGVLRGYFQGHNTMVPTAISQILEQILHAIASVLAAYIFTRPFLEAGDKSKAAMVGAAGGAAGTGVGVVVGLLFAVVVYMMYQPRSRKQIRHDHSENIESYGSIIKIIFFTITPVIFSTFIYNISGAIDLYIFNFFTGLTEMASATSVALYGIYATKYTVLINVPIALASAISAAMVPSITQAFAIGDHKGTNGKVDMAIKFTMLISIPAAVGMAILALPLLTLMFPGTDNDIAAKLLQMGSITVVFYSLSTVTNAVLQGISKMKLPVRHASISLALHVVILVPLLYFLDLHVYALLIATMIFAFSMCFLNSIAIRKYLDYKQDYKGTILIPFLAAAIMGLVTFLVYHGLHFLVPMNAVCLLVAIPVAVFVYFVMIIVLKGISKEELVSFPKGHLLLKVALKLKLIR